MTDVFISYKRRMRPKVEDLLRGMIVNSGNDASVVLAEGVGAPEAAATVATRILVAGLKEPVPGMATEFLRFRLVMAAVPPQDVAPRLLLNRLGGRLDQELQAPTEHRIVTVGYEEIVSHIADLTS